MLTLEASLLVPVAVATVSGREGGGGGDSPGGLGGHYKWGSDLENPTIVYPLQEVELNAPILKIQNRNIFPGLTWMKVPRL